MKQALKKRRVGCDDDHSLLRVEQLQLLHVLHLSRKGARARFAIIACASQTNYLSMSIFEREAFENAQSCICHRLQVPVNDDR